MSAPDILFELVNQKRDQINQKWANGINNSTQAAMLLEISERLTLASEWLSTHCNNMPSLPPKGKEEEEDEEEEEEEEDSDDDEALIDDYDDGVPVYNGYYEVLEAEEREAILKETAGKRRITQRTDYCEDESGDLSIVQGDNGNMDLFFGTRYGATLLDKLSPIISQTGLESNKSDASKHFTRLLTTNADIEITERKRNVRAKCYLCDLKRTCSYDLTMSDIWGAHNVGASCAKVIKAILTFKDVLRYDTELDIIERTFNIEQACDNIIDVHFEKSTRKRSKK